ncbi:MAG: hypothetical protein J7J32_05950 [Candidatus Atribacteria bacterium]|nr:hypothetical protein [Candidatus Atribacteria bacterium]MCD6349345.1 hypothetical protein [Candidatus Atribacteria bacterium]
MLVWDGSGNRGGRICRACNGTGRCHHCRGSGLKYYSGYGRPHTQDPCPWCHGTGVCRYCRGTGRR